MATVEELDYELDFKFDKKTFSNFNKSLKKSVAGFAKLGTALAVAQGVAFAFAKGIADQNDQLSKLAPRLNTTTEEYQKLKFAAEDFGASGEDVTSTLKNLTKAQEELLRGKGDVEAFGRLGINPVDFQNSSDLLLAISDSIGNIGTQSEKIDLLNRIGVSTNLLQALESGSVNIKALGDEFSSLGGVISKEQKQVAGEFQAVWLRSMTAVGAISNKVGTGLLKGINKFLKKFVKFASKNMKAITDGFSKFFNVLNKVTSVLFAILQRIFTMMSRIVSLFGGLENAVLAVGVAFVVLKRKMIAAFIIPLAIATALFLVIEDLFSTMEGKQSVFKDMFGDTGIEALSVFVNLISKSIEGWGLIFTQSGDAIEGLIILIKRLAEQLKNLVVDSLPSFDFFDGAISKVQGLFGGGQNVQAVTNNNGGAQNANITVNISQADGNVIDQLNTYLQTASNRIFGN